MPTAWAHLSLPHLMCCGSEEGRVGRQGGTAGLLLEGPTSARTASAAPERERHSVESQSCWGLGEPLAPGRHSRSCCCFLGSLLELEGLGDLPSYRQQCSPVALSCSTAAVTDLGRHILGAGLLPPREAHAAGPSCNSRNRERVYFWGVSAGSRSHTVSSRLGVARGWPGTWGWRVERGCGSKQGPSPRASGLCAALVSRHAWCPTATPRFPSLLHRDPTPGSSGHALIASVGSGARWMLHMVSISGAP